MGLHLQASAGADHRCSEWSALILLLFAGLYADCAAAGHRYWVDGAYSVNFTNPRHDDRRDFCRLHTGQSGSSGLEPTNSDAYLLRATRKDADTVSTLWDCDCRAMHYTPLWE